MVSGVEMNTWHKIPEEMEKMESKTQAELALNRKRDTNVHEHERVCMLGSWKLASVPHCCFYLLKN